LVNFRRHINFPLVRFSFSVFDHLGVSFFLQFLLAPLLQRRLDRLDHRNVTGPCLLLALLRNGFSLTFRYRFAANLVTFRIASRDRLQRFTTFNHALFVIGVTQQTRAHLIALISILFPTVCNDSITIRLAFRFKNQRAFWLLDHMGIDVVVLGFQILDAPGVISLTRTNEMGILLAC